MIEELVGTGSLTTAGYAIVDPDRIQYAESDGAFYDITVERSGTVQRKQWIFWFDLIDEKPPTDTEVFNSSLGTGGGTDLRDRYGLSEQDERAVEDASGEIVREFDLHDPEDDPPARRGHIFLRRGESETQLVPDPPFTHVAFEINDETHYARAVAEQATVELQQYSYASRRVADSARAYRQYVREEHLAATFEQTALPPQQMEILDTITSGGGRYEERVPLSESFETVLKRLDLDGAQRPHSENVSFSNDVFFRYRD